MSEEITVIREGTKFICSLPLEYVDPKIFQWGGSVFVISREMPPAVVDLRSGKLQPLVFQPICQPG